LIYKYVRQKINENDDYLQVMGLWVNKVNSLMLLFIVLLFIDRTLCLVICYFLDYLNLLSYIIYILYYMYVLFIFSIYAYN